MINPRQTNPSTDSQDCVCHCRISRCHWEKDQHDWYGTQVEDEAVLRSKWPWQEEWKEKGLERERSADPRPGSWSYSMPWQIRAWNPPLTTLLFSETELIARTGKSQKSRQPWQTSILWGLTSTHVEIHPHPILSRDRLQGGACAALGKRTRNRVQHSTEEGQAASPYQTPVGD